MNFIKLTLIMIVTCFAFSGCNMQHGKTEACNLDIMTFNIRYGTANDGDNSWPNRKQQVIDVIAKYHPAVLGVQEALHFQLEEIIKALPQYALIGVGREDGKTKGEYAAILYLKERFTVKDSGTFWLSETPEIPGSKSWNTDCTRICTWADFVDRKTGRDFNVYNLHYDHVSQLARMEGTKLLINKKQLLTSQHPVIVMGDLNAGEDNPAIAKFKSFMNDTFRIVHPDAKDVGTVHSFKGTRTRGKIDYIFIRDIDPITVTEADIIYDNIENRYPSDHFPVRAQLKFAYYSGN
ncbi:MAG: endonuclease/exonuclease/phosphatase family protein [Phycisphaerae bacterium]|nr:endonuclease/exonuclease/phosphatase family protein [Phycisphaerae bacterium]